MGAVLPWDNGWIVAHLAADTSPLFDSKSTVWPDLGVRTVRVESDLTQTRASIQIAGPPVARSSVGLGWCGGAFEVVGSRLVMTFGRDMFVMVPGVTFYLPIGGTPTNAAAVALDATRVALAGLSGLETTSGLSYRVIDVESGAELSRHDYADEAALPLVPGDSFIPLPDLFGPSVALARLARDRVLMAWLAPDRRSILGRILNDAGDPLLPDASVLTRANTDLLLPRFARVTEGRLGMVWTGDSGLEVRYRTVGEDNLATPMGGDIVNTERRCSQEFARIVRRDTGDGALIVWSAETPRPLLGRFVDSESTPHFAPESDLPILGACSAFVGGAQMATSEAGTLVVWDGSWVVDGGHSAGGRFMQVVRASDFL